MMDVLLLDLIIVGKRISSMYASAVHKILGVSEDSWYFDCKRRGRNCDWSEELHW